MYTKNRDYERTQSAKRLLTDIRKMGVNMSDWSAGRAGEGLF